MPANKGPLQLEKRAHENFMALWRKGDFHGQRFGQAFYNHFRLDRLADQKQLCGLFEADGDQARLIVDKVFRFN